jgi:hypothetical protein
LTPLELIEPLAALIAPPRIHRHRYHGVLAPDAPLRPQVTALARQPPAPSPEAASAPHVPVRSPARYLWAALLARIYEIRPLRCALCGSEMGITAFVTDEPAIHCILTYLGEPAAAPEVAPAR